MLFSGLHASTTGSSSASSVSDRLRSSSIFLILFVLDTFLCHASLPEKHSSLFLRMGITTFKTPVQY